MISKVKWFDTERGIGFLEATAQTGFKDVFVHYSNIVEQEGFRDLRQGELVEFDVVDHGRGPKAENIRVVEEVEK